MKWNIFIPPWFEAINLLLPRRTRNDKFNRDAYLPETISDDFLFQAGKFDPECKCWPILRKLPIDNVNDTNTAASTLIPTNQSAWCCQKTKVEGETNNINCNLHSNMIIIKNNCINLGSTAHALVKRLTHGIGRTSLRHVLDCFMGACHISRKLILISNTQRNEYNFICRLHHKSWTVSYMLRQKNTWTSTLKNHGQTVH